MTIVRQRRIAVTRNLAQAAGCQRGVMPDVEDLIGWEFRGINHPSWARTVGIKIRFADFITVTRVRTLPAWTDATSTIYARRVRGKLLSATSSSIPRITKGSRRHRRSPVAGDSELTRF